MGDTAKSVLFIIIVIAAAFLVVYGSFMLLSPSYRDGLKKRPKRKKSNPVVVDRLGGYMFEAGKGISYDESGQLFSYDAPGANPNVKGHYDQNIESEPDPQGKADFFGMFMQ